MRQSYYHHLKITKSKSNDNNASSKGNNIIFYKSSLISYMILFSTCILSFTPFFFHYLLSSNYGSTNSNGDEKTEFLNVFQFDNLVNRDESTSVSTSSIHNMDLVLPKKTCAITISAMNNFGFVWSLYDSIMKNSPSINCFIWYMGDNPNPSDDVAFEGLREIKQFISDNKESKFTKFTLVDMKQMDDVLPNFNAAKVAFMFNLVELQTTIKPFAFQYTFQEFNADGAIYLDNDIWVTDSLAYVQNLLVSRSAVLTPHYSNPVPEDGKRQKDKNVLASGVFNFGFVAFSKSKSTDRFLDWWGERLTLYGFADVKNTMFYDQNWGMFIPAFFDNDDHFVIRDLKYNVAYWNLHERGEALFFNDNDGYPYMTNSETKQDEKVVFMHFSGMSLLEKYDIEGISRHQNRYSLQDFPRMAAIFDAYMALITNHNTLYYRMIPYGYDKFDDGTFIEQFMRDLYAAVVFPVPKHDFEYDPQPDYSFNVDPYLRIWYAKNVYSDPFCKSVKGCMKNTNETKKVTPICIECNQRVKRKLSLVASDDETKKEELFIYQKEMLDGFETEERKEFLDSEHQDNGALSNRDDEEKKTFYDWSFEFTPNSAVDLKGLFYWSFVEGRIWQLRRDVQAVFPDPMDENHKDFQIWFEECAVTSQMMKNETLQHWRSVRDYHTRNHQTYHNMFTPKMIRPNVTANVGLNIIGWHTGQFSIGISAAKITRSAITAKIPVNPIQLKLPPSHKFSRPEEFDFELTRSISHPINLIVVNADTMHYPLSDIPTIVWKNKYNIGYWAWELSTFKEEWMESLRYLDEVWCPSTFIKDAIQSSPSYNGNTPIKVLPIPLDPQPKVEEQRQEQEIVEEIQSDMLRKILNDHKLQKPFVFLVVFDFKSFVERKNPDAAILAFLDAFPLKDDHNMRYQLIVKSHGGSTYEMGRLKKLANGDPRIIFLNTLLSASDLNALYRHQDCFVSLHRSEGYGMIILETLQRGIPVIATNYSGNVDFFRPVMDYYDTCIFPIRAKLVVLKQTYGPYEAGNIWADPIHEDAVKAMRTVIIHDCKNAPHGAMISRLIESNFGSFAVGNQMKDMIKESILPGIYKQKRFRKRYDY